MSLEEWEARWQKVSEQPLEEQLAQLRAVEAELSAELSGGASQWQG